MSHSNEHIVVSHRLYCKCKTTTSKRSTPSIIFLLYKTCSCFNLGRMKSYTHGPKEKLILFCNQLAIIYLYLRVLCEKAKTKHGRFFNNGILKMYIRDASNCSAFSVLSNKKFQPNHILLYQMLY